MVPGLKAVLVPTHLPLRSVGAFHKTAGKEFLGKMHASGTKGSHVVSREVLNETKFLRFLNLSYVREPDTSQVRSWQAVERTTTDQSHGIDGA